MRVDQPSTLTPQQLRILITLSDCPGASLASYPVLEVAAAQARSLIVSSSHDRCGFKLTERGQALIELIFHLPLPELVTRYEVTLPALSLTCPSVPQRPVMAPRTVPGDEQLTRVEHND